MYTRENFEYYWGSCYGSYSEYSLYSIFTNDLNKQGEFKEMIVMRFIMKTAAMTTMMDGPRTVGFTAVYTSTTVEHSLGIYKVLHMIISSNSNLKDNSNLKV